MAVYFAVGTPADDGRIQDFRLVPPPGGSLNYPVLVWNPTTQEPEWKSLTALISDIGLPSASAAAPLVTDNNEWLITDTGDRLVANLN